MPTILIDNTSHPYSIHRSNKRKKSISLKLSNSGHLEVRSPFFVNDNEIHQWLQTRKSWIKKQLHLLEKDSQGLNYTQYKTGERHQYLGQTYCLNVKVKQKCSSVIELFDDQINVQFTGQASSKKVEQILWHWYRKQAENIFNQRFELIVQRLPWVNARPRLTIRKMKSRWGSCSSTGNISLNLHLIKAPIECIDQVVLHELCHLKVFNHSAKFYNLMAQYNPNYKTHEKQLKALVIEP